ncbi:MAG: hypothetical protein MJ223_00920 [Mycoplasmoidaceae bacterium]|nr:hypothetical protein [Mycoplasmoidaceae bacterium]
MATLREVRKYLSNGEIILNICSSFDSDGGINLNKMNKNAITVISRPRNILIDDLIKTVCQCIKKYKIETIKRVIYFKSFGYTSDEIAKIISLKKYIVDEIISMAKRIAESKSF